MPQLPMTFRNLKWRRKVRSGPYKSRINSYCTMTNLLMPHLLMLQVIERFVRKGPNKVRISNHRDKYCAGENVITA